VKGRVRMEFLDLEGARIAYRVHGTGPPLLAPECNYTWDAKVEAYLAERFTLIVSSPRDYGHSMRTGGPGYEAVRWATDLRAVAHQVGYDRFLFLGYSFTGAFGPWLARRLRATDTVMAVAAGGFPLLGDYRVTLADVEDQARELERDLEALAKVQRRFDPLAARAFYRDLATLAPDALVDDLPCPLYCFWGDQDTDAVEMVLSHADYMAGLRQRGVPSTSMPATTTRV
jgi:pimeloyl-ACP methyl ester carboxylesterase